MREGRAELLTIPFEHVPFLYSNSCDSCQFLLYLYLNHQGNLDGSDR